MVRKYKKFKITGKTTIMELLHMPGMYKKLMELGVPCVVCPLVGMEQYFLTLEAVSKAYGLDLKVILEELNRALKEGEKEPRAESHKSDKESNV